MPFLAKRSTLKKGKNMDEDGSSGKRLQAKAIMLKRMRTSDDNLIQYSSTSGFGKKVDSLAPKNEKDIN